MPRGAPQVPCEPKEACVGNNTCAAGYLSKAPILRCASCNPCYRGASGTGKCSAYYRRGGECLKCPNLAWVLIVVFVVVAVGCCLIGYVLSRKQVHLAFLSIGVDYFQVCPPHRPPPSAHRPFLWPQRCVAVLFSVHRPRAPAHPWCSCVPVCAAGVPPPTHCWGVSRVDDRCTLSFGSSYCVCVCVCAVVQPLRRSCVVPPRHPWGPPPPRRRPPDWAVAQVLAMFANSKVSWPPLVKSALAYLSVFNFNLDLTAPECSIPEVTFEKKWLFTMGLPLAAGVLFFLLHVVRVVGFSGTGRGVSWGGVGYEGG